MCDLAESQAWNRVAHGLAVVEAKVVGTLHGEGVAILSNQLHTAVLPSAPVQQAEENHAAPAAGHDSRQQQKAAHLLTGKAASYTRA